MSARLRAQLVQKLKANGSIRSAAVESAFLDVPRHIFLPNEDPKAVYVDRVFATKYNAQGFSISSSSQPTIMATMLEQLDLQSGHNVLEIGAGTGYNAALIGHIVDEAGNVVALDIDDDIVADANTHLADANVTNVQAICTDGYAGFPGGAPYDRIILSVNAWDITPAWRDQLKPDGVLVLPLSVFSTQVSVAFVWNGLYLQSRSVYTCRFMPLRGEFTAPNEVQKLKLMDGLTVEVPTTFTMGSEAILHWLQGTYTDSPVGVTCSMSSSLGTWLGLKGDSRVTLTAVGDAVEQGLVPYLYGSGGFCATMGVLGSDSMALLMRPPGIDVPEARDFYDEFPVYVRLYGADDTPAKQLMHLIHQWDAHGRLPIKQMQLRVYPKDVAYQPQADDIVINKRWNALVMNWR